MRNYKMKACLYLEGKGKLGKSGIGVALKRQEEALDRAGVDRTADPKGEYDLLHVNTVFPKSLIYAQRAKKAGKKVIMHAHTLEEDTRDSFRLTNTFAPLIRKYLKHFYKQADHIICPSEYAKRQLREYGIESPISVVSNGVDPDKFSFSKKKREDYRSEYGLQGTVPFSVGHVFMRKGVRTFTDVARGFGNQFFWFGKIYSGALVGGKSLKEVIRRAPENVTFAGYVDDIAAAYSAGDIFFFPSMAETQGIVILEAWAAERPVLIRDLAVFRDWTRDGKDCLRAKTDEEFKDYLRQLVEDESLRKKLVRSGRKEVRKHSLEEVGKQLKQIYEEVLDES